MTAKIFLLKLVHPVFEGAAVGLMAATFLVGLIAYGIQKSIDESEDNASSLRRQSKRA